MSFHNHLRSNQNICFLFVKCFQNLCMSFLFSCRIKIHTQNTTLRKHRFHHFLNLLCSRFKSSNIRRTAGRTFGVRRRLIAAIMTDQPAMIMKRHGNITVRTFCHIATGTTGDKSGIASSIEKQQDLLPFLQPLLHGFCQRFTDHRTISGFQFLAKIYNLDVRKRPFLIALCHGK